jgi:hypothetical protein
LNVIIPAAGYGTRMGSPEAKELLINPYTGKPFIEFSFSQARMLDAPIVLIIREEKKALKNWAIDYCRQNFLSLEILEISPTSEWPETVLRSESLWGDKNILLLPDTDWKPAPLLKDISEKIRIPSMEVVYGVFKTRKLNWGFVNTNNGLSLCEKPIHFLQDYEAWGIIAFTKDAGNALFKAHLESTFDHRIKTLNLKAQKIDILEFNDRTRGTSDS